jgi:hypothetical protein
MVLRPITVGNAGSTVGDQQGSGGPGGGGEGDIVLVILKRGCTQSRGFYSSSRELKPGSAYVQLHTNGL